VKTKFKETLMRVHNGWILAAYAVICILIIGTGLQVIRNYVSAYNKEQAKMVTGLLVQNINSELNNQVTDIEHVANIILTNEEHKTDKITDLKKYCEQSEFKSVGYFNEADEFYGDKTEKEDLVRMGFASQAVRLQNTYITDPYRSSITGQYIMTIFVPVYEEGKKIGIVYANMDLESIAKFAAENIINFPANIYMFNSKSLNFISCTDMNGVPAGSWNNLMIKRENFEFESEDVYKDFLSETKNNVSEGTVGFAIDGNDYTLGYSSIDKMPNWFVALELNNDVLSDTFTRFRSGLFMFMAIIIALTVICAVLLISKELIQRKEFQKLSSIDTLTGVYNKKTFVYLVEKYMNSGKGSGALIFIDVDDFKQYNDKYGHLNGDIVLKAFAKSLMDSFNSIGYVGRYGGDEFVLFVKEALDKSKINEKIDTVRECLSSIELDGYGSVSSSFSAGGACYPADGNNYEEICNAADSAMYQVKESGKGKFFWYQ